MQPSVSNACVSSISLHSVLIAVRCTLDPSLAPRSKESPSTKEKFESLAKTWPLIALMFGVIGGIYTRTKAVNWSKMPFLADMQVPDPDIMYEGEGAQLMEFAYEGLVRYRPGSAEITAACASVGLA